MLALIGKALATALFIVAVSEIAKRSTLLGALLLALPLGTMLAATLLYIDTADGLRTADFVFKAFVLAVPSLVFLGVMPALMHWGFSFWPAMAGAIAATVLAYGVYLIVLRQAGLRLEF